MERRTFIKSLMAGSAASGSLARNSASSPPDAGSRPNSLVMIADDLAYRAIRALYSQKVHTPNLDRLAARGCAFTPCFQQARVTAASLIYFPVQVLA